MKKILIVEDELSIATFLTDIIQLVGFETRVLTGGRKVMEVAKDWKPDLITLDLMMPPPDGVAVLNSLKNDPATRDIPVFIVSVVANRPEFRERLGHASQIFSKPLDTRLFIDELKKLADADPNGSQR